MAEGATASAAPSGVASSGDDTSAEPSAAAALDAGNYEVIRGRLLDQGRQLQQRAEALNSKRKETFGNTELQVIASERVRTENNCVPRDIVSVNGLLLLGYNVFIGLKSETQVSDVFALHRFEVTPEGWDCAAVGLDEAGGFLQDPQFLRDFSSLYKFTRDARLLQLLTTDTHLLAVFQIGASHRDIKVLQWRIEANGNVVYVDDRGDRNYVFPNSHDFSWQRTSTEHVVEGRFVNVADRVFVSTVGGTLTLRAEDNTRDGKLILQEPVDDANQSAADAQIWFAQVGRLVLLKVQAYRETTWRYFVFNTVSQHAVRIDALGLACVQLPEDHGILFPGGYYLTTGDHKLFDSDTSNLEYKRKIESPNGEDVAYVFHRREDGHYVLFPYNMIRKEVQTPIHCHGYSRFDNGLMAVFRASSDEPTRVHPMQVWDTPFTSAEFAAAAPTDGSFLAKVGNAELVRGISDAFSVSRLIIAAEPARHVFEDLVSNTVRTLDSYYWLDNGEVGDLKSVLIQIRGSAELIIDEFEKVLALKQQAATALAETEEKYTELTRELRPEHFKRVELFLSALTSLRSLRGHIITLRELRYVDLARLAELEAESVERFDEVSKSCVAFMLRAEALAPLQAELEATLGKLDAAAKVADVLPLKEKVDSTSEGLDLLSEVVANLQIDDATQRTRILEGISEVFGQLNRVRATIEARRRELLSAEGKAEFAAQFQLLGQSVSSALALCDTPEKCDDQLSRIMVQLEELEGRFSEFDEFLGDLSSKREEIYDAFNAKKQQLLDERQRRVQNIVSAAERILEGVGRRSRTFKSNDELNAYFASDAMVMKVRQLAEQVAALGDSVKADNFLAKLKGTRQDALRGLRDKLDLFEDGDNVIRLGRHRFSVNTQKLELTMVPRGSGANVEMTLHLSGTDYYAAIEDETFAQTRGFWSQNLISENAAVYRGEYLALSMLRAAEAGEHDLSLAALHQAQRDDTLQALVRGYSQDRYEEGYERGLHDADGARILEKLLTLSEAAGLLRYAATPRALAVLFWSWQDDDEAKAVRRRWHVQARNFGRLRAALGQRAGLVALGASLGTAIAEFLEEHDLERFSAADAEAAGQYLVEELCAEQPHFQTSNDAVHLRDGLLAELERRGSRAALEQDQRELRGDLRARVDLALAWVNAFIQADEKLQPRQHLAVEVAVLLCDEHVDRNPSAALTEAQVEGLLGQHPRIEGRVMRLRIDEFIARVEHFAKHSVPAYRAYRKVRHAVLERERATLRLDELTPRVMTAFVRNKLINDVYLPMVGDNLAKQIGASGAEKRTDLMGLLLLISPPGYGKTTLMEYIANRLGLVFVKVNGPSLGHAVHSLDPSEAPNATARQEVDKINMSFEMGNNVMLYLDDIQHTHSELLQKFISLCDAQRRIEGVWRGRTRTYDMRGRKFCVVMAGNPYTESGDKFQIPDMLANRADTYNLGDILEGRDEAFALSYIENALTSNPVLAPLATRDQSDVYKLIRIAQGEQIASTELAHGYSNIELTEITTVLKHMFRCQRVLLQVNQMYIESASQDDRFRTEPPFKLQGSYRNMNRLAEKIVAALNDDEVERMISDHYDGESQTLTTGAEQNLLKLAEMRGLLDDDQRKRWENIKSEYVRHRRMGGGADDPVNRVTGVLSGLSEDLTGINDTLRSTAGGGLEDKLEALERSLEAIGAALKSRPQARLSELPADEEAAELEDGDAAGSRVGRARQLAGKEQWMKPYFLRIEAALEALGRPQLEVDIHTTPPAEVDELLKQQVMLIERTLVPVVKTATEHMEDSQRWAATLDQVMQLLHQIDARMRG